MQARSSIPIEGDALGNAEVPANHLWGTRG
jgi:hypothetical protein